MRTTITTSKTASAMSLSRGNRSAEDVKKVIWFNNNIEVLYCPHILRTFAYDHQYNRGFSFPDIKDALRWAHKEANEY